jgi:hypothetical protein
MSASVKVGLGILLALLPELTPADELPPFDGQTVADAVLKSDALKVITPIIHAKLNCNIVERVRTEPAKRHLHLALPQAAGAARYERWTVSACAKEQRFSVTFFPVKDGGMTINVLPEEGSDS